MSEPLGDQKRPVHVFSPHSERLFVERGSEPVHASEIKHKPTSSKASAPTDRFMKMVDKWEKLIGVLRGKYGRRNWRVFHLLVDASQKNRKRMLKVILANTQFDLDVKS